MIAGLQEAPEIGQRRLRLVLVAGTGRFPGGRACGICLAERLPLLPGGVREAADHRHRSGADTVHRADPRTAGGRAARTRTAAMTAATLFGLCGAALVGLGLFGTHRASAAAAQDPRVQCARRVACSCCSASSPAGVRRPAMGGDPVPQAMVITGIVVAFSATALAIALLLRLYNVSGSATLSTDASARPDGEWRWSLIQQTAGVSAGPGDRRARCRRGAVDGARRPSVRTHRPGRDGGRVLPSPSRSPPISGARGQLLRLPHWWLGAATRNRAARRRPVGHHARDHGGGDLRDRVVRAREVSGCRPARRNSVRHWHSGHC